MDEALLCFLCCLWFAVFDYPLMSFFKFFFFGRSTGRLTDTQVQFSMESSTSLLSSIACLNVCCTHCFRECGSPSPSLSPCFSTFLSVSLSFTLFLFSCLFLSLSPFSLYLSLSLVPSLSLLCSDANFHCIFRPDAVTVFYSWFFSAQFYHQVFHIGYMS